MDDLVVRRAKANIKIISISYGLIDDNGLPIESVPLRDKINTAVDNGIIVVSAAGNSAEEKTAALRKMADPPRAGMHPRVVQALLTVAPAKIIAVSCNPSTLARDLAMLLPAYEVSAVQPVDLFPHTPHIECVVALEKRHG